MCWASLALGRLVRPSLFSSNVALVLADSCCCGGRSRHGVPSTTVGANVDHYRGTPPLALDPSRKLPFASAKVFEKLFPLEG
jgi:hypothetical protein